MRWRLPMPDRNEDPDAGLAFDFLGDVRRRTGSAPVMTGHDNGVITLNVTEGDDAEREKRRAALGEPYRTLVGHFRHEIGHYYWDRLVRDGGRLEAFRELFGDERADYGQALQRHYREGPPPDWQSRFISAYASSHPWEDFAETWAHYLHIVDALETARSYGINVRASFMPDAAGGKIDFKPYAAPRSSGWSTPGSADGRAERRQPQHGPARPLSVRALETGARQARLRARPDRNGGSAKTAALTVAEVADPARPPRLQRPRLQSRDANPTFERRQARLYPCKNNFGDDPWVNSNS